MITLMLWALIYGVPAMLILVGFVWILLGQSAMGALFG